MLEELLNLATTPEQLERLERYVAEQGTGASRFTVATLREVARFFGYSVQTVKQWRMETPPMPGREGAWPLEEICRWRLAKSEPNDLTTAKKEADIELQRLAIDQKRLDIAKQQAKLLDRFDVERWVAESVIETREVLLAIPDAVAVSMPPEHREFVRGETDRIIREAIEGYAHKLDGDLRAALEAADAVEDSGLATAARQDASGD